MLYFRNPFHRRQKFDFAPGSSASAVFGRREAFFAPVNCVSAVFGRREAIFAPGSSASAVFGRREAVFAPRSSASAVFGRREAIFVPGKFSKPSSGKLIRAREQRSHDVLVQFQHSHNLLVRGIVIEMQLPGYLDLGLFVQQLWRAVVLGHRQSCK